MSDGIDDAPDDANADDESDPESVPEEVSSASDGEPVHKVVTADPDEEAVEEPVTDPEDEVEEMAWAVREFTTVTVVSILALVLLAVALLQLSGLVDFMAPLADTALGQWVALGVVAAGVVGLFVWSRHGV